MYFLNHSRSYDEVLNKAVRLVLERYWNITTARPITTHPFNDFYVICARRYIEMSTEMLFSIRANYGKIEFSEYSQNTGYAQGSVFHTFKCEQYKRNSMEDQQQIEHLTNLIIQFCKERMQIPELSHS